MNTKGKYDEAPFGIISSVVEGESFTITIDKESAGRVKFNWWIVEEK